MFVVLGAQRHVLWLPADLLLGSYVDLHGRRLSLLVQRSVCSTNWLQAQPPRAPRPVCDVILERVAQAEAEAARLIDSSGRGIGEVSRLLGLEQGLCLVYERVQLYCNILQVNASFVFF
jgi:hypothetical protein